ncbi:hypothetical protein [Verrucomicrobium spinosum]|nr:hypothetical protein [Verrucomicrobium spinosum]
MVGGLKALGWVYVTLDLDGLSMGSMNKVLKTGRGAPMQDP